MEILKDKVIDCEYFSKITKDKIKKCIEDLNKDCIRVPKLAVIYVGDNKSSLSYIKGKEKDCKEVGISTTTYMFSDDVKCEKNVINKILELNKDSNVDGILVQLPLPKGFNEEKILNCISVEKDVDCFHKNNVGNLYTNDNYELSPCTPKGIIELLKLLNYRDLSGKKAVVLGRSNIVGKPMAKMLIDMNATVTICHSKTSQEVLEKECKNADILVVAIGKPKYIKKEYIKDGAIVFDVGINRDENNKLCGDVDFEDVYDKVKYITKVPKGIGLITRTILLENTLKCYKNNIKL